MNPLDAPDVAGEELATGRAGHDEAFEQFCRERYARLVMTVNLIVQDRALAQDLAQETLARAYIHWAKLWPSGNPGGWVHRVAVNLAISWRRRAVREARALARLGRREVQTVAAPEVYPELYRALARLPHRQRTAVALHYVLGLPVEEVAKAMGCRPGTVKSLMFSARQRLRKELGEP